MQNGIEKTHNMWQSFPTLRRAISASLLSNNLDLSSFACRQLPLTCICGLQNELWWPTNLMQIKISCALVFQI